MEGSWGSKPCPSSPITRETSIIFWDHIVDCLQIGGNTNAILLQLLLPAYCLGYLLKALSMRAIIVLEDLL